MGVDAKATTLDAAFPSDLSYLFSASSANSILDNDSTFDHLLNLDQFESSAIPFDHDDAGAPDARDQLLESFFTSFEHDTEPMAVLDTADGFNDATALNALHANHGASTIPVGDGCGTAA
jgi:hypothetical protein